MRKLYFAFVLSVIYSVSLCSQGSGNTMDFSANAMSNNNVTIDSMPLLDTSSFTVEMWVNLITNPTTTSYNDAPLLSNKDWNHGQNIGFALHQDQNGNPRINWTTTGSSRIDYSCNRTLINQGWNHLAVVFDRHGYITFYVNGLVTGKVSIAATVGSINNGTYPWRIAQDGTGIYGVKFSGKIDEFRLWQGTRTQAQIQQYMCRKLPASNPNLLTYYNFDHITGTTVPDLSGTGNNGTIMNGVASNVITSGAYIGDTSTYIYSSTYNYTGQTLVLNSAANGNFTVYHITSPSACVHLYQVQSAPNNYTNISAPMGNNLYYGVFIADTLSNLGGNYSAGYNYSDFPNAVTYNTNLALYNRQDNSGLWANLNASNITASDSFSKTSVSIPSEFIIGNFSTSAVTTPVTISSGYALDFQPNSAGNNHVDITPLHALDTASFTVEFWALCRLATSGGGYQDAPFISNKNWVNGANTGMVLFLQSTGAVCANLRGAGGSRVDIATSYNAVGRDWTHVAMTVNRHGNMTIFVNGVQLTSASIAASTGTLYASYDYMLGNDGTGAYQSKFNGAMDEVRIWKGIRTQQQIQQNMCRRVNGSDSNLVAYYRLDEGTGSTVYDQTANHANGTIVGRVSNTWIVSPAPIGDTSFYVYPTSQNWAGQTLSGTSSNGNLTVSAVTGKPQGMHIYRVDTLPLYTTGLHPLAGSDHYYGVFPAMVNDSAIQYNVSYDYSNYATAVSNAAALQLSVNTNHASTWWSNGIITNTTGSSLITLNNIGLRRDFILDSSSNASCQRPSALTESSSTQTSATAGWTTGGSTTWNVRYMAQGINLSAGTAANNTSSNPYTATGLTPGNYYDIYVQDTCAGGSSEWLGPLRVNTSPCVAPDSVAVSHITNDSVLLSWLGGSGSYQIQYGPHGFTLGQGIQLNTSTSPYEMRGLFPNTTYDVYIETICGAANSGFVGPITFTTDSTPNGIREIGQAGSLIVYPNPSADGHFTICSGHEMLSVRVYTIEGELITQISGIQNNKVELELNADKGIYLLAIETSMGTSYSKISIQ